MGWVRILERTRWGGERQSSLHSQEEDDEAEARIGRRMRRESMATVEEAVLAVLRSEREEREERVSWGIEAS